MRRNMILGGSRFAWAFLLLTQTIAASLAGPNDGILAASKIGDLAGVEAALAKGASVNAFDEEWMFGLHMTGPTPLGLAASFGHKNVAVFLLAHGAKVDMTDSAGYTPLHQAAMSGSTDVAKLLLDHHANANARDGLGMSPLVWAAYKGHTNIATLLIARGAVVNVQVSISGGTPLHSAASAGNAAMVALLLARGADPNARDGDGRTPLQSMQVSNLDAATKESVRAALTTQKVQTRSSPPSRPITPPAPKNAGIATPPAVPSCWDVVGLARLLMQANPGAEPRVLAMALEKMQVAMECRQAPLTTTCAWIGSTWTCKAEQ